MCHNESHADRQFGLNKKLENFVLVTILDSDLQSKPLLSIHEASIVAKACFRTGEVELKSMHPFWLRNGRKTPMTVQFSLWHCEKAKRDDHRRIRKQNLEIYTRKNGELTTLDICISQSKLGIKTKP
ncbi:hypothetical protein B9Z55_000071 [Caenorhabditis nigoni]|uniref:Uncharacterized protein n=1 Tax=Caenorhabditis nigoni TaxID=1611254 RepID=A0A2G5VUJ2_9PELO|nr:hypothetical protein B9Z55_000071 [Caenorhabditis nigoni]